MNHNDVTQVRGFLLGTHDAPGEAVLRASGLAAYAWTVLPAEHPVRTALRPDYLAALARHHRIVEELAPLVVAWADAGVEVLFFKGFHMAEFVYPVPGARFHGDVDTLVRREDEGRAVEVAREMGWATDAPMHPQGVAHGVANLSSPGGATQVDLHRFLTHTRLRVNRAPARVTRAVWDGAVERSWHGVTVRTPNTIDALLVLALQRGWWERGGLKPHDIIDMRMLAAGEPEWRAALEQRARKLWALRTVRFFLDRCDPERGRLELWSESPSDVTWRRAVFPERPLLPIEQKLYRLRRAPGLLRDIARFLPDVWHGWRAARRAAPIGAVLASVTPRYPPPERSSRRELARTARAVRWALRLWPRPDRSCLVRSLSLFRALRRQGWPVEFVSGVRRGEDGVTGHAWLELDGEVLPELNEAEMVRLFRPNFRYPSETSDGGRDGERDGGSDAPGRRTAAGARR